MKEGRKPEYPEKTPGVALLVVTAAAAAAAAGVVVVVVVGGVVVSISWSAGWP